MTDTSRSRRGGLQRGVAGRAVSASVIVAALLAVLVLTFGLLAPGFWTLRNALTITTSSSVLLIASLGQLMVLIAGGFDLSVGGVIPLSAVIVAKLTTAGWSIGGATAVCLTVAVLVGAVNTFFTVFLRVNPLITTLGTLSITGGLALILADGQTLSVPAESGILGDRAVGNVAWHVFLVIALTVLMHVTLRHTILGRRIYMLGGNPEAARIAGMRVTLVGGSTYVLSAVFAAVAGVVLASQVLAASGTIGATVLLRSLAAVVLGGAALTGGKGSVPGTVAAVLLLSVIANGMTILLVPTFYQQVVSGVILLIAVTLSKWQEGRI